MNAPHRPPLPATPRELAEPVARRLTRQWQPQEAVLSDLASPYLRLYWAIQLGLIDRRRFGRHGWWVRSGSAGMSDDRRAALAMVGFGLVLAGWAGWSFGRHGDPAAILVMLAVGLFLAVGGALAARGGR